MAEVTSEEALLADLAEDRQWWSREREMAHTGFAAVARRLPRLVGSATALAWRASRTDTAIVVVAQLAVAGLSAAILLQTAQILTSVLSAPTPGAAIASAAPPFGVLCALVIGRSLLRIGAEWTQARLRPRVARIAEQRLYELTTGVELSAYDDPSFHDAMYRARDRGVLSASTVVDAAIDLAVGVCGIAAVAGALTVLHPVLLVLVPLVCLPTAWAELRAARMRYETMHTMATGMRRKWIINELMAERRSAADVRAYGMRGFLLGRLTAITAAEQMTHLRLARRQSLARLAGEIAGLIGNAGVYVVLAGILALGWVALAAVGAAVLAVQKGQSAVMQAAQAINRCYEEGLYFADYLEFCELARRHVWPWGTRRLPVPVKRITAGGLGFTYPAAVTPALVDVGIELTPGTLTVLVGENGSGKTTLAKLLAGLYRPQTGRIEWDGVCLDDVCEASLREAIAIVPQDHIRWPLTARDNITAGHDRGGDTLADVARAAGIHEVISGLPAGYDTLLDARFDAGHELSGGQWQRIAVARALYRGAQLLIYDEPTAAMDAKAEHALLTDIRRGLATARQSAGGVPPAILLITHRLSSARLADRVCVLERGRVAESGTHEELIAAGGRYADMFMLQARAYEGLLEPVRSGQ